MPTSCGAAQGVSIVSSKRIEGASTVGVPMSKSDLKSISISSSQKGCTGRGSIAALFQR